MAEIVTINGKTYQAVEPYTLMILNQASAFAARIEQARLKAEAEPEKADLWKDYNRLWLGYCKVQLIGDVTGLDMNLISFDDKWELENFFGGLAALTMTKFAAMKLTSQGSTSKVSGANSPAATQSKT